jgi:hypothetical protein
MTFLLSEQPILRLTYDVKDISILDLSLVESIKVLKDGRVFSHMAERILLKSFPNLSIGKTIKDFGNIVDTLGNRYELRIHTKSGCSLLPSSQKGIGRVQQLDVYKSKLSDIKGYFIINILDFPTIQIFYVDSKKLLQKTSISRIKITIDDQCYGT